MTEEALEYDEAFPLYYGGDPDHVHTDDCGDCELCGEHYDRNGPPSRSEVGEFVAPDGENVIAHAQCGLDAEYELA